MRKIFITLIAALLSAGLASAQDEARKSVTIFGDSYSTFEGYLTPSGNETFYRKGVRLGDNDVDAVEQTWWHQLIGRNGWELCVNNSYSGSTISSSGYGGADYTPRSFVTRAAHLGNPDYIFVFGATNDSWVPAPMGDYKYAGWTAEDLKSFRPSMAKLLADLASLYPQATVFFILNSELSENINQSVAEVCAHYNVPVIVLRDIDKKLGHPSVAGMKAIADQVDAFLKTHELTSGK